MGDLRCDIEREIKANKHDAIISEIELENAKNDFIERVKNGLGDEIKNFRPCGNHTIKRKKPLKLKFSIFLKRLIFVIFGGRNHGTKAHL